MTWITIDLIHLKVIRVLICHVSSDLILDLRYFKTNIVRYCRSVCRLYVSLSNIQPAMYFRHLLYSSLPCLS